MQSSIQGRVSAKRWGLASVSLIGLMALSSGAQAQAIAPASGAVEEILVTASRIQLSGFDAPTPTTVLGAEDIARNAQPNIFNVIAQLPSLQGSTGAAVGNGGTSGGSNGLSSFNMRGLGTIRTLTLLDGQRVVPANVTGVPDISMFPQLLVKRVDVVTGGASASYGSDAVAGVINFVTDTRFQGFKFNAQGGITNYNDGGNAMLQVAAGRSFFNDKLHLVASLEYSYENGVGPQGFGISGGPNGRNFYKAPHLQIRGTAATPAGSPQITSILNGQDYQYALYGLITAGPLQGTGFGAGGAPYAFQYGSAGVPSRAASGAVSNCINPFCVGGDNSAAAGNGTSLSADLDRRVFYTRASYEVSDSLELFATMNLAQVKSKSTPNPGARYNANLTIQCTNAFLNAAVKAACAANNITSFQFGTYNGQYPDNIVLSPDRDQQRFVVGADGKFTLMDKEWTWNTHYQYGRSQTFIKIDNMTLRPRYTAAIDAVTNVAGATVCRSAVAVAAGCVPYNTLGQVTNTDASWRYIAPLAGPYQDSHQKEDAFSISASGAPINLWAGPLALAVGFEWRKEAYRVKGDPYGNGVTATNPNTADYPVDPLLNNTLGNNWYAGNFHDGQGEYSVKEAFAEVGFSLFDSPASGKADVQLAGRATDYSTSGSVRTWKAGISYDTPIDGIRIRAVRSRDVRAPNLSELYAAPQVSNGVVLPPGGTSTTVLNRTEGNPNLVPERSITSEVGLVFSPSWFSGFRASVDYYSINVSGAISTLTAQQTVDLCVNGGGAICANVNLNGTPANPNFVLVQSRNLASIKTDGLDFETSYRFNLDRFDMPGSITLRGLVTHVRSFITESGVPDSWPVQSAGVNAGDTPNWKFLATQTYENEKFSLSLTERWFSKGVFNAEYIECQTNCPVPTANHPTIDDNSLAGAAYLDIGATYKVTKAMTAYLKVNNVFDKNPEPIPSAAPNSIGTNPGLYDTVGRMYRIGLRASF
jgi:iron complex outermembrane receptor protein